MRSLRQSAFTPDLGRNRAISNLSINNARLKSTVAGQPLRQPSSEWLRLNAGPRYLNALNSSTDADVLEAADRLQDVIDRVADYDAVVVAASPRASLGKIDDTMAALHANPDVAMAEVITVDIAP